MNKRAQAALEFLTTYGWAFLVILIMIGTLAYFGILSPGRFLPNRCTFGSEFQCIDYQISETANSFRLRLKNNVGEAITVQSVTYAGEGATAYTCTVLPTFPSPWPAGNITEPVWSSCNTATAGMVRGEKGKVLITLTYYPVRSGANYAKEVRGEILSTVA
jgi:hypothetical protein